MPRGLSLARSVLSNSFVVIFILAIGAFRPILGDRAPIADDYSYHLLRLAELRHMVEQGVFFSRWMPDLAQGYGYPLFNYFAPLSYYLTLPFIFISDNVATGFQLALATGIVLSGWTMYLLLRDQVSQAAAIIAATAYMYAPYYSYDVLFRSNIGEAMGFFWMPLALWAIGRTVKTRTGSAKYIALAGLSYAAIILTHNVFALIFSPLFGLYGLICVFTSRGSNVDHGDRVPLFSALIRLAGAILLGLAVSAFFWLPAITEQAQASFGRLYGNPGYLYDNNFLTLGELFAWPSIIPTDLINPSPPPALGMIPLLIAVFSIVYLWRKSARFRPTVAFFLLITLLISALVLPFSDPLWRLLPLLQIIQFPWRLLAIGALTLSILCGFSAELLIAASDRRRQRKTPIVLFLLFLLLLNAQGWLYPAYTNKSDKTIADIIPWENATQTLGTTVAGEYLPNTVHSIPYGKPEHIIADPVGYVAERASETPIAFTMTLHNDEAQTIVVNQFAFAGWRAEVNGNPVTITASEPHGLITFPIEAGVNNLRVEFRETPFRLTLDIVSALAFLLAIGMFIFSVWGSRARLQKPKKVIRLRLAVPILVIGLVAGFLLPALRPKRLNAEMQLRWPGNVEPILFANGIELLGGVVPTRTLAGNRPIPVTLYWRVQQTPAASYAATITMQDQTGAIYSTKAIINPPRARLPYATYGWAPDQYAQQAVMVEPVEGIPPGEYALLVTVYDEANLQPIPSADSVRTQLQIGRIELTNPQPIVSDSDQVIALPMQPNLTLIDYQLDRQSARPGDAMLVTLIWYANEPVSFSPVLHLSSESDPNALTIPAGRSYHFEETGQYQTRHTIRLPANLQSGDHQWSVETGQTPASRFASMNIDAPERHMQPPAVETEVNIPAGFAALYGYDVAQSDGQMLLNLVWWVMRETTISYRVFVHVLDQDGELLAQSDGEPANWSRPTTGWLVGEYVSDAHAIALPAEAYAIRVGFYDPSSGERSAEAITLELPTQE